MKRKDAQRVGEKDFIEHAYGVATGWLKWSPDQAWSATIPEIYIAMDAAIEWMSMTTPGMKPKEKPKGMGAFIKDITSLPGTKVYHGTSE